MRILVVEDSPRMARWLKEAGHEVRTADTCFQAEQTALQFRPEAAIIDIGLPDGDGWELVPLLKPAIVVAVTAGRTWADKQKSEAIGVDYHLVNPLTQGDVVRLFEGLGRESKRTGD